MFKYPNTSNVSPPIPPNTSSSTPLASAPFAASGAHAPLYLVLARQQAQEKKYLLWRYVTRKEGPGARLGGGGNVSWTCNFCNNDVITNLEVAYVRWIQDGW